MLPARVHCGWHPIDHAFDTALHALRKCAVMLRRCSCFACHFCVCCVLVSAWHDMARAVVALCRGGCTAPTSTRHTAHVKDRRSWWRATYAEQGGSECVRPDSPRHELDVRHANRAASLLPPSAGVWRGVSWPACVTAAWGWSDAGLGQAPGRRPHPTQNAWGQRGGRRPGGRLSVV